MNREAKVPTKTQRNLDSSSTCKSDLTKTVNAFMMSDNLIDHPERILNEFVINFCIKNNVAKYLKGKLSHDTDLISMNLFFLILIVYFIVFA